tara:strand:+ start:209 stop:592 length:384 start_codon:yes stop_codon:yes gene_type:complete
MINYIGAAANNLEELSEIKFFSERNENLKNTIINLLIESTDKENFNVKINNEFSKIIEDVNAYSNIRIISNYKTDEEILLLLKELTDDHREQGNLKKIETLEQELINNLDESSYSELIKLKSQLNRD